MINWQISGGRAASDIETWHVAAAVTRPVQDDEKGLWGRMVVNLSTAGTSGFRCFVSMRCGSFDPLGARLAWEEYGAAGYGPAMARARAARLQSMGHVHAGTVFWQQPWFAKAKNRCTGAERYMWPAAGLGNPRDTAVGSG